jgi:hypothetical protein
MIPDHEIFCTDRPTSLTCWAECPWSASHRANPGGSWASTRKFTTRP